jgi:hypothetical protein
MEGKKDDDDDEEEAMKLRMIVLNTFIFIILFPSIP